MLGQVAVGGTSGPKRPAAAAEVDFGTRVPECLTHGTHWLVRTGLGRKPSILLWKPKLGLEKIPDAFLISGDD